MNAGSAYRMYCAIDVITCVVTRERMQCACAVNCKRFQWNTTVAIRSIRMAIQVAKWIGTVTHGVFLIVLCSGIALNGNHVLPTIL